MQLRRVQIFVVLGLSGMLFLGGMWLVFGPKTEKLVTLSRYNKGWLAEQFKDSIPKNTFPQTLTLSENETPFQIEVEYTFDSELQDYAEELLHKFQPDYGAIVAVDASTGRVLAMSSYNREKLEKNYAVVASFPAASVFKLVTATAALDQNLVTPDTILPFNGASHTLYKRNVLKTDLNRWTNYMTLKDAFAHSVNTFFGKLGLYHVGTDGLSKYAERYGFNRALPADFPVEIATARIASLRMEDQFSVAEAASGYNHETTLSPLQGALMAASVANDGLMMEPYIVQRLHGPTGELLYEASPKFYSATMRQETAESVRQLMRNTVERGTSRKAFRHLLLSRKFEDVDMGGKTGSLTGLTPKGRTDWFVGYLKYQDQKIAFGAVSVHEKLWRVRSSQLASEFFKKFVGNTRLSEHIPSSPGITTSKDSSSVEEE